MPNEYVALSERDPQLFQVDSFHAPQSETTNYYIYNSDRFFYLSLN